jgi:exonuclease 3'-5' domain-containing protein 2
MADRSKSPLWDPRLGIRFTPPPKPKSLYPLLDITRYIGTSGSSTDKLPKTKQTFAVSPEDNAHLYGKTTDNAVRRTVSDSVIPAPPSLPDAGIVTGTGEMTADQPGGTDSKSKDGSTMESIVPENSLPYRMSAETLERAKKSPTGSPGSYWSHTMYQNIDENDAQHRNVKVHYCTSKHTMEHVCKKYFLGEKVIGFDMEWSPWANRSSGPRQNVALIQIASPSRIGLFHCAVFPKDDFIGPTFQQIMGDANVSKVGVAIKADCTRLKKYMGVETRGILELSHLYKVIKYSRERRPDLVNKTLVTMSLLVEEILKLRIYKGDSVRTSDWTKPLKTQQISCKRARACALVRVATDSMY